MTASKDTPEATALKSLIQAFFSRINASDPQGLQALFVPRAHLDILRQEPARQPPSSQHEESESDNEENAGAEKESLTVVFRDTIETFIKLLKDGKKRRPGGGGPTVHEAPDLERADVEVDGLFGMAWCPFTVTFDGVLHHWGSFVYTFGRAGREEEWRFEGLTQNYRRTPGWEGPGNLV